MLVSARFCLSRLGVFDCSVSMHDERRSTPYEIKDYSSPKGVIRYHSVGYLVMIGTVINGTTVFQFRQYSIANLKPNINGSTGSPCTRQGALPTLKIPRPVEVSEGGLWPRVLYHENLTNA